MSQRKIVVAGVAYIRSRDAARIVQLAPDYVSRRARRRREEQILAGHPSALRAVLT